MDAIAIADANKIRAAMGLPPLPTPGDSSSSLQFKSAEADAESDPEDNLSTLEKRAAAAGSNWAKLEAERQEKIERQKRKEAAKKARDRAAQFTKIEGKGLADLDDGEQDTKSWLLGQKKRQKKIEKQRLQQEERERAEKALQKEYSSKDLAGIKVGHGAEGFGESEQILTLKDAEIGSGDEEDEDELENAELVEREKLEEKLERKKKRQVYDPNEVNETGEKTILGHYDEEISGRKRKRFTLDEKGGGDKQAEKQDVSDSRGIKISLDELMDDKPVNDYAEYKEAKVRKPKKQKKRTTRQKEVDEDDVTPVTQNGDTAMDLDGAAATGTNGTARKHEIEIDDEDLQTQLAMQRRQALKKRKKLDAAELARQIRETSEQPEHQDQDSDGEPGLVIDETREFVSHLKREDSDSETEPTRRRASSTPGIQPDPTDTTMTDADLASATVVPAPTSRSASPTEPTNNTTSHTGLDAEETTSSLGSVAAMLRKRGLIDDSASIESGKRAAHDRAYAEFLSTNRQLITDFDARARSEREADRARGTFTHMTNAQKQEYARKENDKREAYLARLQAEHFARNYKPDVKLQYHDEFGRELGQKEAFKHLSHQFHGKGSGKGKMEKRLKKIEDEKRREGRGLLEEGGERGMGNVAREQGRRRGVAGVRLQ
ncbi:putative SART-1 family protein [Elsinoe australis]|uniref:Putative SART-1 family protein n=1 Tax=Elsinoe australis TaxID=40998 RepID=A0A4V6DU02_9PEZI|nr:putative SART-1 family protein [Elsinoe australis]